MLEYLYQYYIELLAIVIILAVIKISKHFSLIDKVRKSKFAEAKFSWVRETLVECYYSVAFVLIIVFIYYELPQIHMVTDLTTLVKFLFTPPLNYLIILQVSLSLVIIIFSLPSLKLVKVITPFAHLEVNNKVAAVKRVVLEEVEKVKSIYQLRNSMLLQTSTVGFPGLLFKGKLNENILYEFTSYIQGCYDYSYGDQTVSVCAVPLYQGNLDLSRTLAIPTQRILEAYSTKQIITSEEGTLPAEVAVPLEFAQNCFVILYLSSHTIKLEMEDGETISNMWQIIRANDDQIQKSIAGESKSE